MTNKPKNISIIPATLAGALAIAGIVQFAPLPANAGHHLKSEASDSMTAGDVKKEWAEAMDAIMAYSEDQRDEAVKDAKSLLDSMDSRIDKMEAKAETEWDDMSQEARMKRQEALQSLRRQRSELAEWYGGMKHSSKSAWADVKKGFSDAYDSLSSAISDAAENF